MIWSGVSSGRALSRRTLAILLAVPAVANADSFSASPIAPVAPATAPESAVRSQIRTLLMRKVDAMNAAQDGIFHEDVTAAVASFFPPGQTLKDTEAMLAGQNLGMLRPFKGKQDPSKGTMYVATFGLMNGMASSIRVVLDFDFVGATHDTMVLQSMKAFISAKSM